MALDTLQPVSKCHLLPASLKRAFFRISRRAFLQSNMPLDSMALEFMPLSVIFFCSQESSTEGAIIVIYFIRAFNYGIFTEYASPGAFFHLGTVCVYNQTVQKRITSNQASLYVNEVEVDKGGHVITNFIAYTLNIPLCRNGQDSCMTETQKVLFSLLETASIDQLTGCLASVSTRWSSILHSKKGSRLYLTKSARIIQFLYGFTKADPRFTLSLL